MISSNTISAIGSYLFIGIKGSIIALDPQSGSEVWRTELTSAYFTSITLQHERIFAASNGELFCLDPVNGSLLWHNKLKGLGVGFVTFGVAGSPLASAQQQQTTIAASITSASSS